MRGFFLLLLLTNVVFFAWQYMAPVEDNPTDTMQPQSQHDGKLVLLSELSEQKHPLLRQEEGATADAKTAVESQSQGQLRARQRACMRISGIKERETVDELSQLLRNQGVEGIQQGTSQGKKVNYWVMLPPYRNREKATEAADILRQLQVKDFFIVRSGEYENAVSLGVFSTRERATQRFGQIEQVRGRLKKPRIESLALPVKQYWLTYEVGQEAPSGQVSAYMERFPEESKERIVCK